MAELHYPGIPSSVVDFYRKSHILLPGTSRPPQTCQQTPGGYQLHFQYNIPLNPARAPVGGFPTGPEKIQDTRPMSKHLAQARETLRENNIARTQGRPLLTFAPLAPQEECYSILRQGGFISQPPAASDVQRCCVALRKLNSSDTAIGTSQAKLVSFVLNKDALAADADVAHHSSPNFSDPENAAEVRNLLLNYYYIGIRPIAHAWGARLPTSVRSFAATKLCAAGLEDQSGVL
ncbi:hypothetical protein C8J57DRAFT_1238824 [Mycena rebaudengoi]|nr:hypothetical protein C8J57DRAFT_1238824 [Mycena rebaudengoi]